MMINLFIGFLLSAMIALIAFKKHNLSVSGMLGAILCGTLVYGLGHWVFYVFMMFFFMSSLIIRKIVTALSPSAHQILMRQKHKHEARTIIQVGANAGILVLVSVLYAFQPSDLLVFLAAVSMAAATSDTWASEIGILSHHKPHSLIKRQVMETGLSGGVTAMGLWASLAGSALIAMVYGVFSGIIHGFSPVLLGLVLLCTLGGYSGSLIDSILGELFQAKYKTINADVVEVATSSQDLLIQGFSWFDNNLVNFLSNVIVVGSFSLIALIMGVTS